MLVTKSMSVYFVPVEVFKEIDNQLYSYQNIWFTIRWEVIGDFYSFLHLVTHRVKSPSSAGLFTFPAASNSRCIFDLYYSA